MNNLLFIFLLLTSTCSGSSNPRLKHAGTRTLDDQPTHFDSQQSLIKETKRYQVFQVTFPSPKPSRLFPHNNTVWCEFYLPKGGGTFPAVVILPGLGLPNQWIESFLGKYLANRGVASLVVELPYQFHRTPNPWVKSGAVFLATKPTTLRNNFMQAVFDSKRAVDWLSIQPNIDPRRLGVAGISLGACIGAVLLGAEPKVKAGCLLLGGGHVDQIVREGVFTKPVANRLGLRPKQLAAAFHDCEPLTYAQEAKDKPVLLINAKSDTMIPTACALALKEGFKNSRQVWVWGNHYTSVIHLIWIPSQMTRFFKKS